METFNSFRKMYYMALSIIGVPANLVAILILSRGKCGLSTCTTCYLVSMATADLQFIILEFILLRISLYYFPGSFLSITPVCRGLIVLFHIYRDCSVWFTIAFSFDRFVAICHQKLKIKYCTKKTVIVVLGTTWILFCFKNLPFYFVYKSVKEIENVPWFCNAKPSYYSDPGWVAFSWFDRVLTPSTPFVLILLLNAFTVRYILGTSQVRKRLMNQKKTEDHPDPEMESRRKSMILLFTISGSFILLWFLYVLNFLYYNIAGVNPQNYNESLYIFQHVGVMLAEINCCTNAFIYGVTQSRFRQQLKNAVHYPFSFIIQLTNKANVNN